MNGFVLIRHQVKDFATWKAGFDLHAPKRLEAGLTDKYVLRGAQRPNEVIVMLEAQDLQRAEAFAESADLRETMQRFGVSDRPDVYFLQR